MTSFDPKFEHFRSASGYMNRPTNNEAKFDAFRKFVSGDMTITGDSENSFVIQFVCHPNFQAHNKEIIYYERAEATQGFEKLNFLPSGYKRANCYKNFKSRAGHPKGLFFELNLYTKDGRSNHHTSRVTGSRYERDNSHDTNHGATKGKHWLD